MSITVNFYTLTAVAVLHCQWEPSSEIAAKILGLEQLGGADSYQTNTASLYDVL